MFSNASLQKGQNAFTNWYAKVTKAATAASCSATGLRRVPKADPAAGSKLLALAGQQQWRAPESENAGKQPL